MDIDDSEEENDDEDEKKIINEKKNNKQMKNKKKEVIQSSDKKKEVIKKQFILNVKNLPFDITEDEIKQHFLTKAGAVISVKILTKPGTQVPRGIAHVELPNNADYLKALSLHNTLVKGRKIIVHSIDNKQSAQNLFAKNKKNSPLKAAKSGEIQKKKKLSKKGK